mgnify:CR=1 FL=1
MALFVHFGNAQKNDLRHVAPPHWWVGMENDTLTLLLHGDNLEGYHPSLNYSEVRILDSRETTNPNYLFVDLLISDVAEPGIIEIKLKAKGKPSIKFNYELKARSGYQPLGLDQSDVIYLIMPDRFANGNMENDALEEMNEKVVDRSEIYGRHGGDIQGIRNHLDYISGLGVSALWLNPVEENNEESSSYHGYAITDHYAIDPRFGSSRDYRSLVDETHAMNMKMIRDVVLSHFGDQHYLYQDLPDSSWVHFWPQYTSSNFRAPTLMDPHASKADQKRFVEGWFDHHMPDMNLDHPDVASYLIQNSIWWIEEFNIDAYRIDTYAYAELDFTKKWAKAIQAEYPGFFMFAETWVHGAAVQNWYDGNSVGNPNSNKGISGLTDFQVAFALTKAVTESYDWTKGVAAVYYAIAKDYLYEHPEQQVTFLDNHDLARINGIVKGDFDKYKIALGMLMTLRGIPQILYGMETHMQGTENHGVIREDFMGGWPGDSANYFENINNPEVSRVFNYTKSILNWRKTSWPVTQGKMMQFVPNDGVYVYFRYFESEVVMIAVNTSDKAHTLKLDRFEEIIPNSFTAISIPDGASVFVSKKVELQPGSILILDID